MSRPRILHVASVEYTIRRLLLPQLTALGQNGCEVIVACAPQGDHFDEALIPFDPRDLRFPRAFDPMRLAAAAVQLQKIVRETDPDLVHFHTPAAALPGRAFLALTKHLSKQKPLVAQTVHGYVSPSGRGGDLRAIAGMELLLSRFTDLSLFVSREDLAEARRRGFRGALSYIGNGVADEWLVAAARSRKADEPLHAVFAGRLVRNKGILDLLRAIDGNERIELTILGDELPSDRDGVGAIVRRLAEAQGPRVRFCGMVDPDEVRSNLARADVFVLPSYREGLPTSIIEAMASALPIITTSIRGCRELVTPGVNGWLVPPGNPAELARALELAVGLPVHELESMGSKSLERAKAYRLSSTVEAVLHAYRKAGLQGLPTKRSNFRS